LHPIFLDFGSVEIRWYGIMIGLAFMAGTWLGVREARRRGYDPELIYDLLFYVMIIGLVSARLYYVSTFNPSYFIQNPLSILAVWRGGLSIQGGLIGGIAAGVYFCWKRRLPFWDFADVMTPSVILGQAVGRGACALNGCSFGKPTDLPWAITFTDPDTAAPLNISLHPTQFYEMGADFLIFLLVWNLRTRTTFQGQLFLIWAMAYAAARSVIEVFRGDSLIIGAGIPAAHVFGVAVMALAAFFYFRHRGRRSMERSTT
jgi:phosphatidylglycerol---prolipoprotein diacylglyceryl transferase